MPTLEPIRLFVGTAANGEDCESQAVLEHTARKHTAAPLRITWMRLSHKASSIWGGWDTESWATPFSALRWAIPSACGFTGRAIYTDSDMVVHADLGELLATPIPDPAFLAARVVPHKDPRTCVMVLDCKRARRHVPPLAVLKRMGNQRKAMAGLLAMRHDLVAPLDPWWNVVDFKGSDGPGDPRIKILHYSSMPHQPHLPMARARLALTGRKHWFDGVTEPHPYPGMDAYFAGLLAEAIAAGYRPERYEPKRLFGDYDKRSFAKKPLKGFR